MDLTGQMVLMVTPKTARSGKAMWDVALSDGNEWRTFDGKVAAFASNIVNTPGYTFGVALNGEYKNLDSIKDGNGAILAGQDRQQQGGMAPGAQVPVGTPLTQGSTGGGRKQFTEADARRITFLSAISTATAAIFQGLYMGHEADSYEEALSLTKQFTNEILRGAQLHEQGLADLGSPTQPTAAEVVQQVNEAAGAPVVQQGEPKVAW